MKLIPLTRGFSALVDDEDFEYLSQFNWWALSSGSGPDYAARKFRKGPKKWEVVLMHRELLGVNKKLKVDHRDGDSFNNQKQNLRLATDMENQRGFLTLRAGKTSKFRGVHKRKNSWRAQISVNKKVTHLGSFASEELAARAYDAAARKHFKDFASPNFK